MTGEPQFMENMLLKYNEQAIKTGVHLYLHCVSLVLIACPSPAIGALIVTACGFDSIPADLGVIFNQSFFTGPARVSSIESFLTVRASKGARGHFATFESAVEGFADIKSLGAIRKELKKTRQIPPATGPKLKPKGKEPFFEDGSEARE